MKKALIFSGFAVLAINLLIMLPPSTFKLAPSAPPVDGYSALPDIKDTLYFQYHADRFVGSSSPAETAAIKRQIDEEIADAPRRGARVEVMLLIDFVLFILAAAIGAFILARRASPAAADLLVDVSASGLNAARNIRSAGKSLRKKIVERADRKKHLR